MKKKIQHLIEYVFVRALLGLLNAIPLRWALRLAAVAGDLWCLLNGSRRRIAVENIIKAGIRSTPCEAAALARASFRHFATMLVESVKGASVIDATNWRRHVEVQFPPEMMAILSDPGQGLIMASGHLGNWEVGSLASSFVRPVVGIARHMNNPYVDRLVAERTIRARFQTIPKHGKGLGRLLHTLRGNAMLGFMIDQRAHKKGIMVDFFGRPASTHTAVAKLHLITGAPLCFSYCVRTGPLTYRWRGVGPLRFEPKGDRESDTREVLGWLNRTLEAAIRETPEQYLWFHRRWRPPPPRQNGTR